MQRSALGGGVLSFTVMVIVTTAAAGGPANDDLAIDARDAMARLQERDSTLKSVLDSVVGYAIFPEVANGGFIFRGAGGHGEVYEGGKLVGHATISHLAAGAQTERQNFIELVLFKRKSALSRFKKNRFELSSHATATEANQGTAAKLKYADGVAIIILPTTGSMGEASVGGQRLKFVLLDSD